MGVVNTERLGCVWNHFLFPVLYTERYSVCHSHFPGTMGKLSAIWKNNVLIHCTNTNYNHEQHYMNNMKIDMLSSWNDGRRGRRVEKSRKITKNDRKRWDCDWAKSSSSTNQTSSSVKGDDWGSPVWVRRKAQRNQGGSSQLVIQHVLLIKVVILNSSLVDRWTNPNPGPHSWTGRLFRELLEKFIRFKNVRFC